MREKRCTWTLKGWKDHDEDGNEIMRATEEVDNKKGGDGGGEKENGGMEVDDDKENDAGKDNIDDGKSQEEGEKGEQQVAVDSEMSLVPKTSWESKGRQAVREVYRRACLVHCTKKAMIKLRWASFEEDGGDMDKAKEILEELNNR